MISTQLVISSTEVTYNCPGCKAVTKRSLPYVAPKELSKSAQAFMSRHVCKCGLPHEITYKPLNNGKIKIIEFLSQEKSFLSRVKKSFKLGGNLAT